MRIFKTEEQLGLADHIVASQTIQAMATVQSITDTTIVAEAQNSLANCTQAKEGTYNDLFFCSTIICSAGIDINSNTKRPYGLNRNDDMFLAEEVWNARETTVDKPVNIEHSPDFICGHMTSSWVLSADKKNIIAKNTAIKDIPDGIHLACACAVYRKIDTAYADTIKDIILDIESGSNNIFVSLEARFEEFDYFLFDAVGKEYKIVQRNEETSWMSSLLRCYLGTGTYKVKGGKEYIIGRALRDLTFTGKGFVRKPANEESVILDSDFYHYTDKSTAAPYEKTAAPYHAAANCLLSAGKVRIGNSTGANLMAGEITNEQYANVLARSKEADKLEKENEKLVARIEKLTEEKTAAKEQIGDLNRQIKDIEFSKEKEVEAKKQVQATVAELQKQLEEAHAALKKSESAHASINEEISQLKAALVSSKRESRLAQAGIDPEKAKDFVSKWVHVGDDQFETVAGPFVELERLKAAKEELQNAGKKTAAAAIDNVKPIDNQAAPAQDTQPKSTVTVASLMTIPKVKR